MPDRNPTLPLFQSLRLRKTVAIFLCPFALSCPPMGRERWGGNFAGREGGNRKCEMMMMGDEDEMNNFLHSLFNGILRARG
jgi:hypothetical protein